MRNMARRYFTISIEKDNIWPPKKKWMGWERKRGALLELNQLLAGNSSSYRVVSGNPSQEGEIKYVITLDADTRLPIDGAKRLIGMISHPLNKATIDSRRGIVTQGYGLIQPRIDLSVESANTSIFTRIYAGQGGIDPYTTAASDIYQDLFHEAIFTGKGIYSLEVFNTLLRMPYLTKPYSAMICWKEAMSEPVSPVIWN